MTHGPITADDLRMLAETADGLQDDDVVLAWSSEKSQWEIIKRADHVESQGGSPAIPIRAVPTPGAPPEPDDVGVKLTTGSQLQSLREDGDAIFWTNAAMRKFVLPYYARLMKPDKLVELYENLLDGRTMAAVHVRPSRTESVREKMHKGMAPFVRAEESGLLFLGARGIIE